MNQPSDAKADGYWHWSYYLYGNGRSAPGKLFECPGVKHGGPPRTNPGPEFGNWEDGQVDDRGNAGANPFVDRQAPRMSLTANGAIVPRNKFTPALSGSAQRINRYVRDTDIIQPGRTILATEFSENWKAITVSEGAGFKLKSHRPVVALVTQTGSCAGNSLYTNSPNIGYMYPTAPYGLVSYEELQNSDVPWIDSETPLNAIGRHHPGSTVRNNIDYGGTTNFLYVDGHCERKHIIDTMENEEWGKKFYSITGNNNVSSSGRNR
jgi:prepilin-type processing-associated H-X9-DG protein